MSLVWGDPTNTFDPTKGYKIVATKFVDLDAGISVAMTFNITVGGDGIQPSDQDWLDMLAPVYDALGGEGFDLQFTHTGSMTQTAVQPPSGD